MSNKFVINFIVQPINFIVQLINFIVQPMRFFLNAQNLKMKGKKGTCGEKCILYIIDSII